MKQSAQNLASWPRDHVLITHSCWLFRTLKAGLWYEEVGMVTIPYLIFECQMQRVSWMYDDAVRVSERERGRWGWLRKEGVEERWIAKIVPALWELWQIGRASEGREALGSAGEVLQNLLHSNRRLSYCKPLLRVAKLNSFGRKMHHHLRYQVPPSATLPNLI